MDLHLDISSLGLRKFIKSKSQPYFQEFKASKVLLQNSVNITDLNNKYAPQLAKSSLNSLKGIVGFLRDICQIFKHLVVRKNTSQLF